MKKQKKKQKKVVINHVRIKKEKVEVNVDALKRNQRVDQDLKHLQKNRLVVKFLLTVVKATKMKRES